MLLEMVGWSKRAGRRLARVGAENGLVASGSSPYAQRRDEGPTEVVR